MPKKVRVRTRTLSFFKTKIGEGEMDDRFDGLLMNLASQAGGIEGLLKIFFGFMNRRTDFYAVIPDNVTQSKMGFRPGIAEKMVLKAFRSYPLKTITGKPFPHVSSVVNAPVNRIDRLNTSKTPKSTKTTLSTKNEQNTKYDSSTKDPNKDKLGPEHRKYSEGDGKVKTATRRMRDLSTTPKCNADGKQVPEGNGGRGESYFWHQSLYDLTIYVQVPPGTSSKDIVCEIAPASIRVGVKGMPAILEGNYPENYKVNTNECFWSFEKAENTITISLDKREQTWWAAVIQGEPEIDTQNVDSKRKIEEYDDETQATIRKIMFDQDQKRKGLPTSEEIATNEILEKAKYVKGSPFLRGEQNTT